MLYLQLRLDADPKCRLRMPKTQLAVVTIVMKISAIVFARHHHEEIYLANYKL